MKIVDNRASSFCPPLKTSLICLKNTTIVWLILLLSKTAARPDLGGGEMKEGWTPVERGVLIGHDLETTPLRVKTDSIAGSGEKVVVVLHTAAKENAGTIELTFSSPPQYKINHCNGYTGLPTAPPSRNNKIWQLTKLPGPRITVQCNKVTVLDLVLSQDTCNDNRWSTYWSKEVKQIEFISDDTASDYFHSESLDGGWSDFGEWSECSVPTCRGGTQTRTRTCTNPVPNRGGADCQGQSIETKDCNFLFCPNWIKVRRVVKIPYDLETTPLLIKTDSTVGSEDAIRVKFYTAEEGNAGSMRLNFEYPPRYKIAYCANWTDLPSTVPREVNKIWQLTKLPGPRITVLCNGVKVVDFLVSNDTCSFYGSDWNLAWGNDVERIAFYFNDTASDFYKTAPGSPSSGRYTYCSVPLIKRVKKCAVRVARYNSNYELERIPNG